MRGEPHTELRGFFMAVVLVLWRDGRWSDQERDGSRQARQFDVMSQLEMRRKEVKVAADGEMVKSGNGGDAGGACLTGAWRWLHRAKSGGACCNCRAMSLCDKAPKLSRKVTQGDVAGRFTFFPVPSPQLPHLHHPRAMGFPHLVRSSPPAPCSHSHHVRTGPSSASCFSAPSSTSSLRAANRSSLTTTSLVCLCPRSTRLSPPTLIPTRSVRLCSLR